MGYSANSIRAYRGDMAYALEACADLTSWSAVEKALAELLGTCDEWKPATFNRRLGTWRTYAADQGNRELLSKYRSPKQQEQQHAQAMPEGIAGVQRMIASTRNPIHKSLCALTGLLGLRVAEALVARPSDVNLATMSLTVHGKGNKLRVIPITAGAWDAIEKRYLACLDENELLVPLSDRGARRSITRHGRRAGLSLPVSSHDMRATFATAAYAKTKDLRALQELLGHDNVTTTQRYASTSWDSMKSTAAV